MVVGTQPRQPAAHSDTTRAASQRDDTTRHGTTRHGTARHGTARHDTTHPTRQRRAPEPNHRQNFTGTNETDGTNVLSISNSPSVCDMIDWLVYWNWALHVDCSWLTADVPGRDQMALPAA